MRLPLLILLLAASPLPAAEVELAPSGFRYALPGWAFEFPRDHGAHPEFQTEWWYFTGHLEGESNRRYGFELTFFRVGVKPPASTLATEWDLHDLSLAHFAISDLDRRVFRYHEKVNRGSVFTAAAGEGTLDLFNENWSAVANENGSWSIRASAGEDAINLELRSRKPPAIHGAAGVSVKGDERGAASHYYSMTRLEVSGSLSTPGSSGPVTGQAWMDHEFSTSILGENQTGWDWFSLQLDDGTELMLYQIRSREGIDPNSSGSFIREDGRVEHLTKEQFSVKPAGSWRSPRTGAVYPMGWNVEVPILGIRFHVSEAMKDQELVTTSSTGVVYWEGAVRFEGTRAGRPARGLGYVEMTGYDRPFRMRNTK